MGTLKIDKDLFFSTFGPSTHIEVNCVALGEPVEDPAANLLIWDDPALPDTDTLNSESESPDA